MPIAARHDPPSAHAGAGAVAATVGSGMEEYARRCGREEEYEVSIRSVCTAPLFVSSFLCRCYGSCAGGSTDAYFPVREISVSWVWWFAAAICNV